jgi:hypothetical protein
VERDIVKFGKQKIKIKELVPLSMNQSALMEFNQILVYKEVYDDLKYKEGIEHSTNYNTKK